MQIPMPTEIRINTIEAIEILAKDFGFKHFKYIILDASDKYNKFGCRGVFEVEDESYHGSPDYHYYLKTCDVTEVHVYELLKELYELAKFLEKE